MLTDDELLELLRERGIATGWNSPRECESADADDKIRAGHVCAFANDLPGNRKPGAMSLLEWTMTAQARPGCR